MSKIPLSGWHDLIAGALCEGRRREESTKWRGTQGELSWKSNTKRKFIAGAIATNYALFFVETDSTVSHQRSDSSFQDGLHNTYRFALVGKSQSSRTRRDWIYVGSPYQKAAPHGPFVTALVSSIRVSHPLFHDFFPHVLDLSLDDSQRDIFSLWVSGKDKSLVLERHPFRRRG